MGLDMYLTAKQYLWRDETDTKNKLKEIFKTEYEPKQIEFEIMYWRKANAIHNWFVQNVQNGNDNCSEYYVSKENIETLLEIINEVLSETTMTEGNVTNGYKGTKNGWEPILEKGLLVQNPQTAKILLPTAEGFFFGSQDYDQYYIDDLKETKTIFQKILADNTFFEKYSLYYQSSW